jgi:hypothetical protein
MFRLQWAFRAWIPFEALFAYDIVSLKVATPLPFIPPLHYLSPPIRTPPYWMEGIPPYLLIWPIDNMPSGLFTDYILLILGVVLGLVGMDRGWRYKAWIPLGVFLLNVTVLIVLGEYNRPSYIPIGTYTTYWLGIVIPELLGVVPGIIGMDRGWGYKAWIPLGVFLLIVTVYTTVEVAVGHADGLAMAYITVWSILMIVELLGVALAIVGMGRGWGYKAWIPLAVLSVPVDFIFMYFITYVPG